MVLDGVNQQLPFGLSVQWKRLGLHCDGCKRCLSLLIVRLHVVTLFVIYYHHEIS